MIRYSTKMQFSHKLSAFLTAFNFLLLILFKSLAKSYLFMLFFFISTFPLISWIIHVIGDGYPVSDEEED